MKTKKKIVSSERKERKERKRQIKKYEPSRSPCNRTKDLEKRRELVNERSGSKRK